MIRYVFRIDTPLRIKNAQLADPQAIGEALQQLSDRHGGRLKSQYVVDQARREKSSPFRPHLEWDDKLAAEAHRRDQARELVRLIVRIDGADDEGKATPAFLSINDAIGVAFRPVQVIQKSVDFQVALMAQAERDLEAFERRYAMLKDVCRDVAAARKKLRARLTKDETRAPARGEARQARHG